MSDRRSRRSLRELAEQSNAWPFEEARKIVARLKKKPKDEVIFETGYGPSGLPHIGTFGEVARTTMVRHAFRVLTDDKVKTRLIAFSDDMDGLRKVPDNVPNQELLAQHLGKPLTQVPDPFGTHPTLRRSTTTRGCAPSSTPSASTTSSCRRPTATSPAGSTRRCCEVLARFDAVMAIMLPSLREERAPTYSPFLPISPQHRHRAAGADRSRMTPRPAPSRTTIPDTRERDDDAGHRRALQAAMEARLGDALGRARRRLRDGRQGPDRLGEALRRDLPRARRHAAGRLQLRALPRREGPEDLQVEGQRPDHRRMAALRAARESCRCSCIASRRRRSGSIST